MKTHDEIQEILSRAKSAISNSGGKLKLSEQFLAPDSRYVNPYRHSICFQFLINERQIIPRNIVHIYLDSGWAPENEIYVRHGHFMSEVCFANFFCHVSNFQLTGVESPIFRKFFQEKWSDL